jgi:hypothetical protein
MKKTFVNQDKEYSVYLMSPMTRPVFQPTFKEKKTKPNISDSWQVMFSCPSTFPVKTGLGLKEMKEEFVILSADIGPHKR